MAETLVIENVEIPMQGELMLDPFRSELTGENGEVYLFQWLSSTEKKRAIIVRLY